MAVEFGSGRALIKSRMDLAASEWETNYVCCSEWASETHSQIFNPDDFCFVDDSLASCVNCDFHPALGGPS
jgi:hypothetical protein